MAACAAISGCGGGGSSLASPSAPPVSIAPAAAGHAARINELRACAGLAPLSWNGSLAAAAQAHSSYLAANGEFGHGETPGAPLYYGLGFSDRMAKAGFAQLSGALASETLVGGRPDTEQQGRDLADVLMTSPEHRLAILAPDFSSFGVAGPVLTVDLGADPIPYGSPIVMFPCQGAQGVHTVVPSQNIPFASGGAAGAGTLLSLSSRLFSQIQWSDPWLRDGSGNSIAIGCSNPAGSTVSAVLCAPSAPLSAHSAYSWGVKAKVGGAWRDYSASFVTGAW